MNSLKARQGVIVISTFFTYKGLNIENSYEIYIFYAMLNQLKAQYLLNSFKWK